MPAKNAIKQYQAGGYYHIYNRGVNKCTIFRHEKDYKTFLSYMKLYLLLQGESLKVPPSRRLKNYSGEIDLLCYCLMPNHFHLLVRQNTDHGIDHFMRSLSTKYVRYFNANAKRIGPLFQGPYKAVNVESEYQYIYLSKYIHRNPISLFPYEESPRRLHEYRYSSYGNYLQLFSQDWVKTAEIMSYFSHRFSQLSYQSFVDQATSDDVHIIKDQVIDITYEESP